MLNEVRSIARARAERERQPPIVLTEALRGEGIDELWDGDRGAPGRARGATGALEERRRQNLAGRGVRGRVARARRRISRRGRRRSRATAAARGGPAARARPADGCAGDHGEGVHRLDDEADGMSDRPDARRHRGRARAPRTGVARGRRSTRSETLARLARPPGPAEGREPAAHGLVQDPRRRTTRSRRSRRRSAPRASWPRAPATTARRSRGPRARRACAATIFMPQDAPMAKVEADAALRRRA